MPERAFQNEVIQSLTELKAGIEALRDRLNRINGSVAKHEEKLQGTELWKHSMATTLKSLQADVSNSKVSNRTLSKITTLASFTVLAIANASGPIVQAVLQLVK